MSEGTESTEALADKPSARRGRPVRTPGASVIPPAAAAAAAGAYEGDELAEDGQEDARTPGLRVQEDGSIVYAGRVHRKPFQTPHGLVVPACSVEPGNAAMRR